MHLIEASKKKRLINLIIDIIVIALLVGITIRIENNIESKILIKTIRAITVFGGYHILMEYFLGKTIGKYVTNSKVVNKDGSKIDFRTAVIRYMCRFIPFEFASLALGYDAKAWHDTLSKTYVIEDNID